METYFTPRELVANIFYFLDGKDIEPVSYVNKAWRSIVKSDEFLKQFKAAHPKTQSMDIERKDKRKFSEVEMKKVTQPSNKKIKLDPSAEQRIIRIFSDLSNPQLPGNPQLLSTDTPANNNVLPYMPAAIKLADINTRLLYSWENTATDRYLRTSSVPNNSKLVTVFYNPNLTSVVFAHAFKDNNGTTLPFMDNNETTLPDGQPHVMVLNANEKKVASRFVVAQLPSSPLTLSVLSTAFPLQAGNPKYFNNLITVNVVPNPATDQFAHSKPNTNPDHQ